MVSQTTYISPAEYLATHFPDREPEYVRGELRYKPMPDRIHAKLQARLILMLSAALQSLGFSVEPEVRCKLDDENYRLPDVAVFPDEIDNPIPNQPPFVAIEIVSKDEKHTELLEKLEDYRVWGVPNIWVVDPWRRQLSIFDASGLRNVLTLRLPEQNVEVGTDQLLKDLPLPPPRRHA